MQHTPRGLAARDKLLFTPGPLTTSPTVKAALLRDLGSRDEEFLRVVAEIRGGLLALANAAEPEYAAVPIQGSGTYGLEAVIASAVPRDGGLLVAANGAYGRRIARMAEIAGIPVDVVAAPEDEPIAPRSIDEALAASPVTTHVAVVHCETTSGLVNPIEEIGAVVSARGRTYIVDAMSSFGALPIDVPAAGIHYLVSSANKCVEGVPGFSFAIVDRASLASARGSARSLSLDLQDQLDVLDATGQFRFTPPVQAMLAFAQALRELHDEGGPTARRARYAESHRVLVDGMLELGFEPYLRPEIMGPIITSFRYPTHPAFDFDRFYRLLSDRGFVIYPGKVGDADCFRIGTIGRIDSGDVRALLRAIAEVLASMEVPTGPAV